MHINVGMSCLHVIISYKTKAKHVLIKVTSQSKS